MCIVRFLEITIAFFLCCLQLLFEMFNTLFHLFHSLALTLAQLSMYGIYSVKHNNIPLSVFGYLFTFVSFERLIKSFELAFSSVKLLNFSDLLFGAAFFFLPFPCDSHSHFFVLFCYVVLFWVEHLCMLNRNAIDKYYLVSVRFVF